ncbi:extracellular solute-binding protein [Microbacterium sp. YMB-B2]|uniref:Extracellular solute-binding protein n=1 Tax=Microbacterium tenebrionis TaxID=2830665 RepID=A0A9X1LNC8_9MICO|nr:extracellular solute-binding protein [Microbacterium tenebrionis]MCC2028869.1 extracellular solute-binding protein [Microbacterium tenebrionis]
MHVPPHSRRARSLAAISVLAIGAATLAACAPASDGTGSEPIDLETPAVGTIEVWTQGADGADLPEIFATFEEENPDVTIKLSEVPEAEFASKITAAIAAGTVPDLIYGYTQTFATLLSTEGFAPVPDGVVEKEDFFENIWELSVIDDTAYGVPWYAYANSSIYRSDLAEQANVKIPETWDEVIAYSEGVQAEGVEFPVVLPIAWNTYTAGVLDVLAHQNNSALINDDNTEWTINEPANVEALEYFASFIQDGLASADGPAFLDIVPWISQGRAAAMPDSGTWFTGWLDEANGEGWSAEHITIAPNPIPEGGTPAATLGGGSWFVPIDADNPTEAWQLVHFMSQPETQVEWYKIFGSFPAVKAAWDDPALEGTPLLETTRESLNYAVSTPNVATWPEVSQIIASEMEKVARGTSTAEDALDAAQERAAAIGTE